MFGGTHWESHQSLEFSYSEYFKAIDSMAFIYKKGFLGGSVVKNLPANAGDMGSIPGLGRTPGEGSSNPLQYSCLGNSRDRGAWLLQSMGSQESRT